jgi:hypothetical protein
MFQEALQFQSTNVFCYNKHITMKVTSHVPPPLTWQFFQTIIDRLSPIVFACVFDQSHGHWLLNDVLHFAISMSLKLREKNHILLSFESLMDDDLIISDELSLLSFSIRREVINVLDFFLPLLKVYDRGKTHNMIFLMLDPKYKNLCIISSFVRMERCVALVEEYDRKSLYPMLVKCHEHLHLLVRSKRNSADHNIFDEDCSLDA